MLYFNVSGKLLSLIIKLVDDVAADWLEYWVFHPLVDEMSVLEECMRVSVVVAERVFTASVLP